MLEAGTWHAPAACWSAAYSVEGTMVPGHGIGSKQTVPTLNLATDRRGASRRAASTSRGRYEPRTARHWPSVTNIGDRPTFGGDANSRSRLSCSSRSREKRRRDPRGVPGTPPRRAEVREPEALKAQILKDVARAEAYFRRLKHTVRAVGRRD